MSMAPNVRQVSSAMRLARAMREVAMVVSVSLLCSRRVVSTLRPSIAARVA